MRVLLCAAWLMCDLAATAAAAEIDYLKEVKPLLAAKCAACHGGLRQRGNLRLDTAQFALKGGDSGPAIVVGNSAKSLLIEALLGENGRTKMPIEGEPLKLEQIELLRRWIDAGAKAPADEPVADPRDHWAFQKPTRRPVPLPKGEGGRRPGGGSPTIDSRSRERPTSTDTRVPHPSPLPMGEGTGQRLNPIDAFIDAEQQSRGLIPLPEADKPTLLRRVFIDLIGLPPTADDLREFLNNNEPDAYERLVDRLLESPEHARRWARHWMDIWRYSDWYGSRGGNELRNSRRHIWRWRDWIIESLAADKGYDRMLVEMLAADEAAPGDRDIGRATGFLGRNYYVFNRNVWLHDTVEFTSAAFLGLTFKCCRCHDHKYDPLAQEEYFRLRAFFEPLSVRTDQLAGRSELITGNWPAGAPPGHKLKDGDDFVFDADLAVPTYLLDRGNEKNPVTDKPLAPGVPSVLGFADLTIEPVKLPPEAFYPDMRPERRLELTELAQSAIDQARASAAKARDAVEIAQKEIADSETREIEDKPRKTIPGSESKAFFEDHFAAAKSDRWKVASGDWQFTDGKLALKTGGYFSTIVLEQTLPRDFKAIMKYRTTGGSVGSIGLFFDLVELKHAQAVYTHVNPSSSGVQAFHRQNAAEVYPTAGIVSTPLKLNAETTLEITARGQSLTIVLNGDHKLSYTMPLPRQPGRFALWGHEATGEFLSLRIAPLEVTAAEARASLLAKTHESALADKLVEIALADADAVKARIAAELANYHTDQPAHHQEQSAFAAAVAEGRVIVFKAELECLKAEQQLELLKSASKPDAPKAQDAIRAAQMKLAAARTAIDAANAEAAKLSFKYTPIGPTYPQTSTGRRLALAKWMTNKDNPLTARVAVNHIWKRHFGSALVPSVANFGLNGKPPTHPALLDWLAVEFMESGWSMKHLHRLIVTSAAYRRRSGEWGVGSGEQSRVSSDSPLSTPHSPLSSDPDNRFYWRANVRRMEAEVVRDTLWSLTEGLDRSFSGSELDPATADTTPRRSLYFRHTPDDQAMMLELFDGPSAAECFERTDSIMPQQALALANSPLALMQSRKLARLLSEAPAGAALTTDADFLRAAFERVLSRTPNADELAKTEAFLQRQAAALADPSKLTRTTTGLNSPLAPSTDPRLRARENLVHVLLNYHEFVTVR